VAQQHRKFTFDGAFEESTFVRDLDGLCTPWTAAQAPSPRLLALNEELATELSFDPDALRTPEQVAVLVGNRSRLRLDTRRAGLRRSPVRRLVAAAR